MLKFKREISYRSMVHFLSNLENKEDNALKAKLRRLCEAKKGGKLQVPQWLHDEWRNGDHLQLARQYQACNFDKAPLTFYSKLNQVSVSVDACLPFHQYA